jgi:hypothetical protein
MPRGGGRVERYSVDLDFDPPEAMTHEEREAWRDIVADALRKVPGSVGATFIHEGDTWVLQRCSLGEAWRSEDGEPAFRYADDQMAPCRDLMLEALRSAGKAVRIPHAGSPR